jgi:putative ABC transport system substrate-binding protein
MTSIAAMILSLGAAEFASAQTAGKAYRVGWLGNGNPPAAANRPAGEFQQGLRDAGYVEGRTLSIEYRYAGGSPDRLAENVAELVRLPVDVIVTSGERAARAAMRATKAIPIVVTEIGVDPVRAGFVASLPSQRRRASYYVDKILKGAKPADLPVERPTLFELVVDLKTAKALGLVVPTALMVLADDLIE